MGTVRRGSWGEHYGMLILVLLAALPTLTKLLWWESANDEREMDVTFLGHLQHGVELKNTRPAIGDDGSRVQYHLGMELAVPFALHLLHYV